MERFAASETSYRSWNILLTTSWVISKICWIRVLHNYKNLFKSESGWLLKFDGDFLVRLLYVSDKMIMKIRFYVKLLMDREADEVMNVLSGHNKLQKQIRRTDPKWLQLDSELVQI